MILFPVSPGVPHREEGPEWWGEVERRAVTPAEAELLGAGRAFLEVGILGTGVPQPEKVSSRQAESKGTTGRDRSGRGTGPRVPRRVSRALALCMFVDWARCSVFWALRVWGVSVRVPAVLAPLLRPWMCLRVPKMGTWVSPGSRAPHSASGLCQL